MQVILDSLNADRGTALDASNTHSIVYAENMAIARAISATWGTNERLGNSWIPARMSEDILERWEAILALAPAPTDTAAVRRQRVAALLARAAHTPNSAYLNTILSASLGSAFVGLEFISFDNALIHVPDGTYPWGSVSADMPWSSTVCHILIKLQKPSGWTERAFYDAAAMVGPLLEPILPVWVTFDWYRGGPISASIPGGPSAAGFYLDDTSNLDNELFDV